MALGGPPRSYENGLPPKLFSHQCVEEEFSEVELPLRSHLRESSLGKTLPIFPGTQITSGPPPLTKTLTGVSLTLAAPLLSSMPEASKLSFMGACTTGGPTSRVSPPAPGTSLIVSFIPSVLRTFACAKAGTTGTSPEPQKQPLQMGRSGLPPSHSTHTLAPTGGTAKNPTPGPAYGTHGIAQPSRPSPSASGELTWTRPSCKGSTLFTTLPRYLPKTCLMSPPPP